MSLDQLHQLFDEHRVSKLILRFIEERGVVPSATTLRLEKEQTQTFFPEPSLSSSGIVISEGYEDTPGDPGMPKQIDF